MFFLPSSQGVQVWRYSPFDTSLINSFSSRALYTEEGQEPKVSYTGTQMKRLGLWTVVIAIFLCVLAFYIILKVASHSLTRF